MKSLAEKLEIFRDLLAICKKHNITIQASDSDEEFWIVDMAEDGTILMKYDYFSAETRTI